MTELSKMAKRWYDELIIVMGVWLFVSPWALSYSPQETESWNAFIAGAAMVIIGAITIYRLHLWGDVANFVIGIWTAISPWALRYAGEKSMMMSALVVGIVVALLALWGIWNDPNFTKHWPGHHGAAT